MENKNLIMITGTNKLEIRGKINILESKGICIKKLVEAKEGETTTGKKELRYTYTYENQFYKGDFKSHLYGTKIKKINILSFITDSTGAVVKIKDNKFINPDIRGKKAIIKRVVSSNCIYVNVDFKEYKITLEDFDIIKKQPKIYNYVEIRTFDTVKDGKQRREVIKGFTLKGTREMLVAHCNNYLKDKNIILKDVLIQCY